MVSKGRGGICPVPISLKEKENLKELKIELHGKTKNEIHQFIQDKQREAYDDIVKHNIQITNTGDKYNISFSGPVMGFNFVLNGSVIVYDGYVTVDYEHNLENSFIDNAIEMLAKRELEKRIN